MKKFLSLFLTVCMLFSMTTMVFADEQTTIRYVADGTSAYEVTVPELMTPGTTDTVTLEGTWTSEEKVVVSAPDTVTLTNDIDGDTEDLAVTFNGFSVVGDNRESFSLSEDITVAAMPEDVIFGTWEGIITYSVSVESAVITFTIDDTEYQMPLGMTWYEWVNSDYNTYGFTLYEGLVLDSTGESYLCYDDGSGIGVYVATPVENDGAQFTFVLLPEDY